MVPRDIQNISPKDPEGEGPKKPAAKADVRKVPKAEDAKAPNSLPVPRIRKDVMLNYPRPIALSKLIEETAQWSEYSFIMDPSLDCEVQIFAPHPLSRDKAFGLVIAATENVGLRMVELDEKIIKIVPATQSSFEV